MRRSVHGWMGLLVAALLVNLVARPHVARAATDPSDVNQPVTTGEFLRMLTAVGDFSDAPDFWPQYWKATEKSISGSIQALPGFQDGHPSAPLLRAAAEDDVLVAPVARLLGSTAPDSAITLQNVRLWCALWLQVTDTAPWVDGLTDQRISETELADRAAALMAYIGMPVNVPLPGDTLSRADAAMIGQRLWQLRHGDPRQGQPPARGLPVILLHGAGRAPDFWTGLPNDITDGPMLIPAYNSVWGVRDGLRVLRENVRDVRAAAFRDGFRSQRVAVVGHSLGGVIGRLYISQPHKAVNVDTLITLASPHQGYTKWREAAPGLSGVATDLLVTTAHQVGIGGSVTRFLATAPLPQSVRVIAVAGAPSGDAVPLSPIGDRFDTVVKTMHAFPSTMAGVFMGLAMVPEQPSGVIAAPGALMRSSSEPTGGSFYGWARGAKGEIQWVIAENKDRTSAEHEPVVFHPFTVKLLRFYLKYPQEMVPDSGRLAAAQLVPASTARDAGPTPERVEAASLRLNKLGLLGGPVLATGTSDLKLYADMTRGELAALIGNALRQPGSAAVGAGTADARVTIPDVLTALIEALGVPYPPHLAATGDVLQAAVSAGLIDAGDMRVLSGIKASAPLTRGFAYYLADRAFYGARLSNGKTVYTTFVDMLPPDLTIAANGTTTSAIVTVHGTASPDTVAVHVAGLSRPAKVDDHGIWSVQFPLAPGPNRITAAALDLAGNRTEMTVTVVRYVVDPSDRPSSAEDYYALGMGALDQGDYGSAVSALTATIRLAQRHALAYCGRGVAYQQTGDPDAADADLTKSIMLAPTQACGYEWRGYLYLSQGKLDQALADYQQAIGLEPGSFVLYYQRGLVYSRLGENVKALADFRRVRELSGDGVWGEAASRQIEALNVGRKYRFL